MSRWTHDRQENKVWVTLIANLLITLLQKGVSRSWSFSGLATIVRIMLMYYIDVQEILEHPEKDWEETLASMIERPPNTADAEKSLHAHAHEGSERRKSSELVGKTTGSDRSIMFSGQQ